MKMSTDWIGRLLVFAIAACLLHPLQAQTEVQETELDENLAHRAEVARMTAKTATFLRSRQHEDGSFSPNLGTGVTSLVATGLLRTGRSVDEPMLASSIKFVLSHRKDDGGIYLKGSRYRNYETSVAILLLTEANSDGKYDEIIKKADAFLKMIQWDAGEGKAVNDPAYGGAGYGKHNRPDLSNTAFLIEALHAAGNEADSEALQKAIRFVSRCQNLESQHNTTAFPAKNPDGGFYYTAAAGGSSQAGETPNGGLRSYASMTYAGLKSMIYAGVGPDDPRVKAATEWIRKHYDLKSNPGMGQDGLFYYYHTFAKALAVLEQKSFKDADGKEHHWRAELIAELKSKQQPNGSWINPAERWYEGNADLVSAYALLALSYCR